MKLIYKPWGSDAAQNPRGFPADYPRDSMRIEDNANVPDGWIEISENAYNVLIASHYAEVAQINASLDSAPDEVLLWQFRTAVTLAGLKESVDSTIAGLPEPAKTIATEKWEYGNTIRRNHPMIAQLSALLGLTSAQVDDVFKTAASLA